MGLPRALYALCSCLANYLEVRDLDGVLMSIADARYGLTGRHDPYWDAATQQDSSTTGAMLSEGHLING